MKKNCAKLFKNNIDIFIKLIYNKEKISNFRGL